MLALIALSTLFALLIAAAASAAPLPKRPTSGGLSGGAPPPGTATDASEAGPLRSLSLGASGAQVMSLQRALRKKGLAVRVDGSFGPATRKAVRKLQARLGIRVNGVASVAFLRRLGLRSLPSSGSSGTGGATYLRAFPVGGSEYSYSNDFGAPRHQGAHQGNDIICPRGAPILSATYGEIQRLTRVETGLGGLWIWIIDPQGNEYYYAHLSSVASGLQEGTEVWPGRAIGACGNTGDARYGVEHLHFEVHPGGGGAISPYSDLVALDPKRKGKKATANAKRSTAVARAATITGL